MSKLGSLPKGVRQEGGRRTKRKLTLVPYTGPLSLSIPAMPDLRLLKGGKRG
jgi:hypothetical protein